jgi:hypothetical protein
MAQDVIFASPEGRKEISVESLTLDSEDSTIAWRGNQDNIFALVLKHEQNFNWCIARVASS